MIIGEIIGANIDTSIKYEITVSMGNGNPYIWNECIINSLTFTASGHICLVFFRAGKKKIIITKEDSLIIEALEIQSKNQ